MMTLLFFTETEISRIFIITALAIIVILFFIISNKLGIATNFLKKGNNLSDEDLKNLLKKAKVIDFAPDAIVTIDSDGKILTWNKGAEIMFGYKEEEVLDKPLSMLILENYRFQYNEEFRKLKEDGNSNLLGKANEIQVIGKEKKEFTVDMLMWMWADENKIFYSTIINNQKIEEQQKNEKSLKIYYIGEEIDKSGIWHWDVITDNVFYSKGFYKIFNIDSPSSSSSILLKQVYYADRPLVEAAIKKVFENKSPFEMTYRVLTSNGKMKYLNGKINTYLDEDGSLHYISCVLHEIKVEEYNY